MLLHDQLPIAVYNLGNFQLTSVNKFLLIWTTFFGVVPYIIQK